MNLSIVEIKSFVPAKNFELSKQFYTELGFYIPYCDESTAVMRLGACGFLLQNFYLAEHASNTMMHLQVENLDDWWLMILNKNITARFNVQTTQPEIQPWAMVDFTLTDPSGVVWRISQNIGDSPELSQTSSNLSANEHQ